MAPEPSADEDHLVLAKATGALVVAGRIDDPEAVCLVEVSFMVIALAGGGDPPIGDVTGGDKVGGEMVSSKGISAKEVV